MKISRNILINHLKELGVNKKGIQYVLRHFDNMIPSRLPTSSHMSIHDVIASRKVGWTQDSESRAAELPLLLNCEFSRTVLIVFSQPESIVFRYKNSKEKNIANRKTQDFLVVTISAVLLVECKTVVMLEKECHKRPELFAKDEYGYRCPPGEEAASEFGIQFRVSTDRSFTARRTRNYNYLFSFIDDLGFHDEKLSDSIREAISKHNNRVNLKELYDVFSQLSVIQAMYHGYIRVDLDNDLLCHPDLVWA